MEKKKKSKTKKADAASSDKKEEKVIEPEFGWINIEVIFRHLISLSFQ